jgi:ATP-binding cassette, subfamily G (WHITE), member 2, SNQ2
MSTSPFRTYFISFMPLKRRDEADIKSRQLGVVFENLRVVGLGASASLQPTLGSLLNPLNLVAKILSLRHPPLKDIISGFEGVVRPGEMLREYQFSTYLCLRT